METVISAIVSILSSLIIGCIMAFVVNRQAKRQESRDQERTEMIVSILETTNASLSLSTTMAKQRSTILYPKQLSSFYLRT